MSADRPAEREPAPTGATCRAVELLSDRLEPASFVYAFGDHLQSCGACRALLAGPELRGKAVRFLASVGQSEPLPEPTQVCQQVEYLTTTQEAIDSDAFARSFAEHILSCRRCLSLVPKRIAPELLVRGLASSAEPPG